MSALVTVALGLLLAQPVTETGSLKPTKVTLADVVKNVEKNEKLYDAFEMRVRQEYRLADWDGKEKIVEPKGEPTAVSTTTLHVILDGERFLQETEKASLGANTKKAIGYSYVSAYDGKQTLRISRHDQIEAEIYEMRIFDPFLIDPLHPNVFLYENWNLPKPFSKFLTMPDRKDMKMRWTVLGEEKINGLRCVKLLFENVDKDTGANVYEGHFWLAINRNYLPVHCTFVRPHIHPRLEHGIGWVSSLKEVEAGIWVPERGEKVVHDHKSLQEGTMIPHHRTEFEVVEASLGKKQDDAAFHPEIPEGAVVRRMKDGKAIDTYRQGTKK